MHNKDYFILLTMLESTEKIIRYASGYHSAEEFHSSDRDYDAVMMNFIVIGEQTDKLSDEFKAESEHINWFKIYGLRNILAHHYFGINADTIWQIINDDIPKLRDDLSNLID